MDSLIFLSYRLFNNTEYAEMMYCGFRLGFRLFLGPYKKAMRDGIAYLFKRSLLTLKSPEEINGLLHQSSRG